MLILSDLRVITVYDIDNRLRSYAVWLTISEQIYTPPLGGDCLNVITFIESTSMSKQLGVINLVFTMQRVSVKRLSTSYVVPTSQLELVQSSFYGR